MKLIVGLGNPGEKYKGTRHNLGLAVIDAILKEIPAEARLLRKLLSLIFSWQAQDVVLAKPTTFMNQSGRAVKKLLGYFKVSPPDLWVIHDDVDLVLGKVKIQVGRGAAGHRGVESIINGIGNQDFVRFRLGIGRPEETPKLKITDDQTEKFVLARFTPDEKPIVDWMVRTVVELIKLVLKEGLEMTRSRHFEGGLSPLEVKEKDV